MLSFPRHLALLEQEYERLRAAAEAAGPGVPVPACPGWTLADLVSHVAEVYLHKAEILRRGAPPEPWPPPPDPAGPVRYLDRACAELRGELAAREPGEAVFTWYDPDQTVGFWARRMALESVVHRVDAELAAGLPVSPVPEDLALDGIDEILVVMLAFETGKYAAEFGDGLAKADGRPVAVVAGEERWLVRATPAGVEVARGERAAEAGAVAATAAATVAGAPQDVLLWAWGRQGTEGLTVSGDGELVERLRWLLKESTQ
ncbi:maleylpyruvate isomerase family mycothiol-dependent enzyme [Actinomadura sp. ATCC 31491]|uniref:Maleylpyruvate isomerase family mycothiol-dependent enzyme n=1 Tax=Actinomadura luzonensis TaxID=2805427 RepID=A0ABT0GCJ9_9ACTN|nr:maleylpyruvate isomerase N-terminal domain-containing protein [Actinomadura luzonensis]MCK2221836.1 maleylpyruvate isomerase family mycothiol-dependent enzyme [Actinomadura luzonensis]